MVQFVIEVSSCTSQHNNMGELICSISVRDQQSDRNNRSTETRPFLQSTSRFYDSPGKLLYIY